MKTLVITPTYNERENLPNFARQLFAHAPDVDLLIVDDNSPDGTGAVADELARENPRIRTMHRSAKLGLGTAYVSGFKYALENGYTHVFEMDADLSHDPQYLPLFFKAFSSGADVVVGSRNVEGGNVIGWGPLRHFISKGGSLYSRTILSVGVRDLTSGYKGFRADVLRNVDLEQVASQGYSFQIELTYRAIRKGYSVVEVPIVFVDRKVGASKMSGAIFAEAVRRVWELRFAVR